MFQNNSREIKLPIAEETAAALRTGELLLLSGKMLVGRDQVHRRLAACIDSGDPLPVSLGGELLYYMGPAPAPEGKVIGSCGPTTASRMDQFTPALLEKGLLGTIGKGPRSLEVVEAVRRRRGLYLYAFGGCGALYARSVLSVKTAAFEDLGPEALLILEVHAFPVIVAIDSRGTDIFSRSS